MASKECLNKIWDMISQFVCWEFCRNSDRLFNVIPAKNFKTDLITFFKDMVIEMTMKEEKEQIGKSEILAKFIEELNHAVSSKNFDSALNFVPTLNFIFPELSDTLEGFLNEIEEKCEESNRTRNGDIDSEIFLLVKAFTTQAFHLLPLPDLFKIYETWQNNSDQIIVNAQTVKERLLAEQISLAANKSKILKLIATDSVYKTCLNEKNNMLSSDEDVRYLDAIDLENGSQDSSATTIPDDNESDTSSVFEDCESDLELDANLENSNVQHSTPKIKSISSQATDSLFHSCPSVESFPQLQECHVVLEDLAASQDPMIQDCLVEAGCVNKNPVQNLYEDSLSSNSEEDFIESPPKKFFRGWEKGSKEKTPTKRKRARPSKSPDKRLLRKRSRGEKKNICHFCRKYFNSKIALQSHDCQAID